jgi:hypothetical protein
MKAPVQPASAELVAPDGQAPRERVGRVEAPIAFTKRQMVGPRYADDVHGFRAHTDATKARRLATKVTKEIPKNFVTLT